jgi:hypothetical protein
MGMVCCLNPVAVLKMKAESGYNILVFGVIVKDTGRDFVATQESFCKIVKHYAGGRIWHFMLR